MFNRRLLIGDGVATLGTRVGNMLLALITSVLIARALGPSGRGVFALPSIDAGFVTVLFTGLTTGTSFFMLNRRCGRGALRAAYAAASLLAVCGCVLVFAIAVVMHHLWAAVPAALFLPASALTAIATGYAYGTKRVRYGNYLALLITVTTLLMLVGAFAGIGRTPNAAIAAWLAGTWLAAIVATIAVARDSRGLDSTPVTIREYLHFAGKVGVVNFVTLMNYRVDVYLVAFYLSTAQLGIYTVAVAGAESLLVVTQVASIVTGPHIAAAETSDAAKMTSACVRLNFTLALLMVTAVFVCAPWFVSALYGPKFMPAVAPLRLLLAGVLALSTGSVVSNYFTLRLGKPEVPLALAGLGAIVCGVVSVLLIPKIGLLGAATGTATSYIIGILVGLEVYRRYTGIGPARMLLITPADFREYHALGKRGLSMLSRRARKTS